MKPNLEGLTDEQKERLRKLEAEVRFDKLIVSFAIEDRDGAGRRKQTFYSASVTRNGEGGPSGWTQNEAQITSCLLSRHVVATTYRDALRRKVLPREVVATELPGILQAYDQNLVNLLAGIETEESKTSG